MTKIDELQMLDLGTKIMMQAEAREQISIEDVRTYNMLARKYQEEAEHE